MSGILIASACTLITDKWSADWNATLGTSGSALGLGDNTFGASLKQSDLAAIIAGLADNTLQSLLSPKARNWPNRRASTRFNADYSDFWSTLNGPVARLAATLDPSIINFDTLLHWYNVLAPTGFLWGALAPPDWVTAYGALTGGLAPNPLNVYYSVVQGATYQGTTFTNALAKLVVIASTPAFTAGFTIPPANYAGGFIYWTWSGATYSVGTTATITLTGLDQAGNAETYVGVQTGASGSVLLTPQSHAYSLGTKITAAALSAHSGSSCTAVTGYAEAHAPGGRSNPPG